MTCLCLSSTDENFGFGSYYDSHMVLQKEVSVSIWGYAVNESDLITLTFDGTEIETTAGIGECVGGWGGGYKHAYHHLCPSSNRKP